MGKSITAPYVVEIRSTAPPGMKRVGFTPTSWFVRDRPAFAIEGQGKPTDAKLQTYVYDFAKSLEAGGVNHHLATDIGYIPYPTSAVIRENRAGGATVARWQAPTFMVW